MYFKVICTIRTGTCMCEYDMCVCSEINIARGLQCPNWNTPRKMKHMKFLLIEPKFLMILNYEKSLQWERTEKWDLVNGLFVCMLYCVNTLHCWNSWIMLALVALLTIWGGLGIRDFWWDFLEEAAVQPSQRSTKTSFCSQLSASQRECESVAPRSSPCRSSRQGPVAAASRQLSQAEARAMLHTHRAVPPHSTIYLSFVAHNQAQLQMAQLHGPRTVKSLFCCVNSRLLPWPGRKRGGQESPQTSLGSLRARRAGAH